MGQSDQQLFFFSLRFAIPRKKKKNELINSRHDLPILLNTKDLRFSSNSLLAKNTHKHSEPDLLNVYTSTTFGPFKTISRLSWKR